MRSSAKVEDPVALQIRHHGEVAVPLGNGFLIHADVRDDLLRAAAQPAGDRALLDAPRLVPRQAQQPGGALHRALPEELDGQPFEQGCELAAGLRPGDGDLLDSMARAGHPRDLGVNPRRELAGIHMPPAAALPIVARHPLLALGAGVGSRPGIDGHDDLLLADVQFHVGNAPGFS